MPIITRCLLHDFQGGRIKIRYSTTPKRSMEPTSLSPNMFQPRLRNGASLRRHTISKLNPSRKQSASTQVPWWSGEMASPNTDPLPGLSNALLGRPNPAIPYAASEVSVEGDHMFQAWAISAQTKDAIGEGRDNLLQNHELAGATHVPYAYRFSGEVGLVENFSSDGDLSAGLTMVRKLRELSAENMAVYVAHHAPGSYLYYPDYLLLMSGRSYLMKAYAIPGDGRKILLLITYVATT